MTKRYTTGPVDRDFEEGDLDNWHLEVFNNGEEEVDVKLTVYSLITGEAIELGSEEVELGSGEHASLTVSTVLGFDPVEHTLAVVKISGDSDHVLFTLYGRNIDNNNLSGAVYPRHLLEKIDEIED